MTCFVVAEIVQLRVARSSRSNTIETYERVRIGKPNEDIQYQKLHKDRGFVSKPSDEYMYACAKQPAYAEIQISASGKPVTVSQYDVVRLTGSEKPSEKRPISDQNFGVDRFLSRQASSFQSEELSPAQVRSVSTVFHDDPGRPALPPRSRNTVDRSGSRRRFPTPPRESQFVVQDQIKGDHRKIENPSMSEGLKDHHVEDPFIQKLIQQEFEGHHQRIEDPSVLEELESHTVKDPFTPEEPPPILDLSVEDVADCLRRLQLEAFVDTFQQNGVDGALLSNIDEDMLATDFAMSRFQAKKLMMYVKGGWRPKNTDAS